MKGTHHPFTSEAECAIPYTQRVNVPSRVNPKEGFICCGGVSPSSGNFYEEDVCLKSGWIPDKRQQSIHRAWNDIIHDQNQSSNPLRYTVETTEESVSCPSGHNPFLVNILGQTKYVCFNTSIFSPSEIYNGPVGNLSETVVFSSCQSSKCKTPFNKYVPKPASWSPKYELGQSAGCGVCQTGQRCVLGLCRGQESSFDSNRSMTVGGIILVVVVSLLFAILVVLIAYYSFAPEVKEEVVKETVVEAPLVEPMNIT